MATGLSIKLASQRLGVSENTVNTHLKSIYKKLNVRNRVEMMNRAMKMGLI
jgi:two-component system, NarL family, nitrate/nitrite response regulator NarL